MLEQRTARNNPFRSERIEALPYRFRTSGWNELRSRLEELNYRGIIVGPHGAGKTCLLDQIESDLRSGGLRVFKFKIHVKNHREQLEYFLKALFFKGILLIDGADQFSYPLRSLLLLLKTRVIATSHSEHSTVPTLIECDTSIEETFELVEQLVDATLIRPLIKQLWLEKKGNVREVLRSLYDLWACGKIEALNSTQ